MFFRERECCVLAMVLSHVLGDWAGVDVLVRSWRRGLVSVNHQAPQFYLSGATACELSDV